MRPTLILAAALLLGACRYGTTPPQIDTPADSAAGVTEFEMVGPGGAAIVVPVFLNGEGPNQFVIDTGATLTCINEALSDSLQLPERTGQIGFGAGVGGSGRMRLVAADSLRVGGTTAQDITLCAIDLDELQTAGIEVDGLLGLNFLQSFRVTLDFSENTLHLEEL